MGNKRLIHAVAGSGKTTKIIESINPNNRNLIITYTENNQNNIRLLNLVIYLKIRQYLGFLNFFIIFA